MDQRDRVQQLCEDHAGDLRALAITVGDHQQWDLTLPIAVIDARSERRRFHVSAVGTIGNVVRVSTTIDHPLMQQLFELIQTGSDQSALAQMRNDADHGEEFSAVFEMYQEERRGGGTSLERFGCSILRCEIQRSLRRQRTGDRGPAAR